MIRALGILALLPGMAAAQSSVLGNSLICSTATLTGNAFSVGGSTFVVSGGNVGIGTASPGTSLVVAGTGAEFSGTIAAETHTDANVYAGTLSSTPRIIFGGATATHEIDNDGSNLRFFRPGAVDMSINSSGGISITKWATQSISNPTYVWIGSILIEGGSVGSCGSSCTSSVTFPLAFPTNVVSLQIAPYTGTDVAVNGYLIVNPALTGFTVDTNAGGVTKFSFYWMAIGY